MNPTGKIPTLVDDDFVLWESNSILRYLAMQYGESSLLYPPEPKSRASMYGAAPTWCWRRAATAPSTK